MDAIGTLGTPADERTEMLQSPSGPSTSSPDPDTVTPRHPLAVRLWHWTGATAIIGLLATGLLIFNIHPRLYWGEVGNAYLPAAFAIESPQAESAGPLPTPVPFVLRLGVHTLDVTGWVGSVLEAGSDGRYFLIFNTPESWHFGALRGWHFACAWLLVLAGLAYAAWLLRRAHWRRLLPDADQLTRAALLRELRDHLRLRPAADAERRYNLLQKIAYLILYCGLLPLMVLSGLTMSNGVTARLPQLFTLFGGRESARTLHAIGAALILLFIIVHLVEVFAGGLMRTLTPILTGRRASAPVTP